MKSMKLMFSWLFIENTNALFYHYQMAEAEEESYSVPCFVAFLIALN